MGGTEGLSLNTDYPVKARKQGVEGRLKLNVAVRSDKDVSNATIAESLHPLCDAAPVDGLRSVDFVSARRDGHPIPIRTELPIRSQLTAVSGTRDVLEPDCREAGERERSE